MKGEHENKKFILPSKIDYFFLIKSFLHFQYPVKYPCTPESTIKNIAQNAFTVILNIFKKLLIRH